MSERTKFPPVFWVANLIEVLERFDVTLGLEVKLIDTGEKRGSHD